MAKLSTEKVTILTFDFNESEDTKIYAFVREFLKKGDWYDSFVEIPYKVYGQRLIRKGEFAMPTTSLFSDVLNPEEAIRQFEEAIKAFAGQEDIEDIAYYTGARAIAFCNNEYSAFILEKKYK